MAKIDKLNQNYRGIIKKMNKVILLARLTRDVEVTYTQQGTAIAKMGLAFDSGFGDNKKSSFIDVTAFGKRAETINQYFSKGSRILIEAELQLDQWTTDAGEKRSKHALVLSSFSFVDSKGDSQANAQANSVSNSAAPADSAPTQKTEDAPAASQIPTIDVDEDEIPF